MHKPMVKNICNSVLFLSGLIALLLLASSILSPKNNDADNGMIDPIANGILGEPENTIDVVILGDSETYSSMIPLRIWENYRITSYCCGTSGQTLSYSEQFLRKAFQSQKPKIVILETNAIFRKMSASKALINRVGEVFSVFPYHNRWKKLKLRDFSLSVDYTCKDATKGYRLNTTIEAADDSQYMKPSSESEAIPARNRFYIEKMMRYCEDNGARFIMISTPSTVNWNSKRHNAIQALAEELNVEYIDMNLLMKEIPIDWKKDSRDKGDHLNYYGAEKVTAYLGKYLNSTGLVDVNKENKICLQWDEAVKNFNKTIKH